MHIRTYSTYHTYTNPDTHAHITMYGPKSYTMNNN